MHNIALIIHCIYILKDEINGLAFIRSKHRNIERFCFQAVFYSWHYLPLKIIHDMWSILRFSFYRDHLNSTVILFVSYRIMIYFLQDPVNAVIKFLKLVFAMSISLCCDIRKQRHEIYNCKILWHSFFFRILIALIIMHHILIIDNLINEFNSNSFIFLQFKIFLS